MDPHLTSKSLGLRCDPLEKIQNAVILPVSQYKATDEDTLIPNLILMYKHVQLTCCLPVWSKKLDETHPSLSKVLKYILVPAWDERREKQKAMSKGVGILNLKVPQSAQYRGTTGRIHGELLRLLFIRADKKTPRSFQVLVEAVDVDSEVYCWRRSGDFWRMRASLCLAACNSGSGGNAGLYGTSFMPRTQPAQGWSWYTLAGPQTCRIASPLT